MASSVVFDHARLRAAYEKAREELLAERTPDGHWVGELSSSALATATAVSALAMVRGRGSGAGGREHLRLDELISRGVGWLVNQQNEDGGFGDTDLSHSNIATTMLVVAALHLAGKADEHSELILRANGYIDAKDRLKGLRERYGIDKTFVVPIMTNLALAGLVEWREVDPLPFELACVPQAWYRFVGMPVVSYAIPALVAIGQARFFHAPPRNPFTRLLRSLSVTRSLKVLRRMQPDSGGYLEATPLTSFVVMSLASISKPRPVVAVHEDLEDVNAACQPNADWNSQIATTGRGFADAVIREGVKFLVNSARLDGSWPIDTNLATWNTTLAINALAGAGEDVGSLLGPKCLNWLLSCQHHKRHPFTGANPGGFGWSDLSGAVPDADDTPGAMLAMNSFVRFDPQADNAAVADPVRKTLWPPPFMALTWLGRLRNADGGWPTFCRGWGKLPFDRSGVDITAHALRAIALCFGKNLATTRDLDIRKYSSFNRALKFIERKQHSDGSWSPLWFGNQDHPNEENPVYGTAKVLMAYRDLELMESAEARHGVAWLVENQNEDGGWGCGAWERGARNAECGVRSGEARRLLSSIEETALAVEALLAAYPLNPEPRKLNPVGEAIGKGLIWLVERVERGEHRQSAPIGFYFAKLWYYERLYPLTFSVAALGRACRQFAPPHRSPDIPAETASADAP